MTQTPGPGLNKDGCAAALSRPARQAHLAVLAAFAETGRPRREPSWSASSGPAAPIPALCWPSWPSAT